MIGDKFPSEMRTFKDPKTGNEITQLTSFGINYHFYFTDNSFTPDDQEIYFLSNRDHPDSDRVDLFHMDLKTGEMEQLTSDPDGIEVGCMTKTRDSHYIAYITGRELRLYDTKTKENKLLFTDHEMIPNHPFFNCDNTLIGFTRDEYFDNDDNGPNYGGFKDKMYAVKDGRVAVIGIDGRNFHDVYCDTTWLSHFQFSPDDPDLAMFCHEGPWNYVTQRIWLLNVKTGQKWPCFRQGEDDCVGHEFWSEDGDIIFDNRRGGHDGTISSSKEQVYAVEQKTTGTPYFGFAHKDGRVYRKVEMPYYCNHYFANRDLSLFVGDALEDIVLIRPDEKGKGQLYPLANHHTTWLYQRSHCHPTFSWDNTKILYAADTDPDHCNLFLAKIPDEILKPRE